MVVTGVLGFPAGPDAITTGVRGWCLGVGVATWVSRLGFGAYELGFMARERKLHVQLFADLRGACRFWVKVLGFGL